MPKSLVLKTLLFNHMPTTSTTTAENSTFPVFPTFFHQVCSVSRLSQISLQFNLFFD